MAKPRYSLAFYFRQLALFGVLLALAKYRVEFSYPFLFLSSGMLFNTSVWLFVACLAGTVLGALLGGFWDGAEVGGVIGMLLSAIVAPFFIAWHWWGLMNAG